MKFIRDLFGKRRVTRVSSNWSDFNFPSDVTEPEAVGVFSSSDISSAWSAVYMASVLQNVYPSIPVHFVTHSSVAELAGFLPVTPQMHIYTGDPGSVDPEIPEGVLMFSPQPEDSLLRFVEKASPLACVSTQKNPAVNIIVKIGSDTVLPHSIYELMKVLKMEADTAWKPVVPGVLAEKASSVLSPVSHRTLPYILATEAAANVLEKKRAEVPLKIVLVDGKTTVIPPETSVGLLAAMVAGASAMVTTDRNLWIHARALGIPVIGLDRKGVFSGWGGEPAPGDTMFLEQWATLIRVGW